MFRGEKKLSEQLRRVIYVSEKVGSSERDVTDIINASARNNPSKEITGCLLEGQNSFLQILEGPSNGIQYFTRQSLKIADIPMSRASATSVLWKRFFLIGL